MKPSIALQNFTKHSEGCSLTAYPDSKSFSIGYGHYGVEAGTVWTQQQADEAFQSDMAAKAKLVQEYVKVSLTQNQFDCLCDLFYNVKLADLIGSQTLAIINSSSFSSVPDCLYRVNPETGEQHGWIFADGKVDPGLIARRQGEIKFWNGDVAWIEQWTNRAT